MLTFVEDQKFTKGADRLLAGEELFVLMEKLSQSPEAGALIPGSGGYRKLRFAAKGKGSRGGARIIYFYHSHLGQVRLVEIYAKNEKTDLSSAEWKILQRKGKR